MFVSYIKGFRNKTHLLEIANQLEYTKLDFDNLTLIMRNLDKDKLMKLSGWIIRGIDKTKELYYDISETPETEYGN